MWLHKEASFPDTLARLQNEGFAVKDFKLAGETCWLIFPPHSGIEWNENNLIYRSSIWTSYGVPVSLSWKKFFNWDERCDLAPKPETLEECELMDKIDGSTLIVSKYKGELIMRTRGSTDMTMLDNGHEKDLLIKKYKDFFDMIKVYDNTNCSYIFEWVTPSNRIVLDYGEEPELILTGVIRHDQYSYVDQKTVDSIASMSGFNRPKKYKFDSLEQLHKAMEDLKGIEGICCYYVNGQDIKKVKTDEYLMLHSIKFKLGYKALVDMIYEENVQIEEFKKRIEERFDHEGLKYVEKLIDTIYDWDISLKNQISFLYHGLMDKYIPADRKTFAKIVFEGDNPRKNEFSGFLFKLYESDHKDVRTLLMNNASLCEKFKKMILARVDA